VGGDGEEEEGEEEYVEVEEEYGEFQGYLELQLMCVRRREMLDYVDINLVVYLDGRNESRIIVRSECLEVGEKLAYQWRSKSALGSI
jgi:hypothetical protein